MATKVEKIKQLALDNGFTVTDVNGNVQIYKKNNTKIVKGLAIFPDGSGYDMVVDSSVAKTLKTFDQWKQVLAL